MKVMSKPVLLIIGGLLLSGCFVISREVVQINPMSSQWGGRFAGGNYASNGEQIYFTAANENGQHIRYSGGPAIGGMMMGAYNDLACVSCHGADGRGGLHTMHMDVMDAPDIRIGALSSEEEGEHADASAHADQHAGYGLEDFRRAIVEGTHPDGEPLNRDMPRWQMNDDDLSDLFEYLASLP